MDNINQKIWEEELRQTGARLTKPRRAILDVLASSSAPMTPMEIFNLARQKAPNLGLVTVYRTIERMESLGCIDRIHSRDQCQMVFRSASGHRHLLTCTTCGKSVYVDGLAAENEIDAIGRANGFKINGHMLQLFGLCRACQKKDN